jgi:multiple sugar transport system substrate-binding protein
MQDPFDAPLTRRRLLSRSGRLAVGAVAGSGLLAACGGNDGGGGGGSAGPLRVALHQSDWDSMRPFFDAFTKESGIKIRLSAAPPAGGDQVTQLTPQFSSQSSPVDVLQASDEATPSFIRAGWLAPITQQWDKVKADHSKDMQDYVATWSSLNGQVYRIPTDWSVGFYWVRQDVLDKLGVDVPASWDDVLALAPKAQAKGMYAFADAASKPSLATVYMAYLCSQTGGKLFDFDAGTRQAFEFAGRLIDRKAFPKAALNWTYDQLNANYMNDRLATMREWNFFYDVGRAEKKWFKPDKMRIVLPPAGPAGRGTWAGAWGWAIPKFTDKTDQAKRFVEYMTSSELAPKLAKANSAKVEPRTSILDAMGDEGLAKAMSDYSKSGVTKPRPFHPNPGQAQSVVDTVVSAYLSGQMDLDQAMSEGKSRIKAL